MLRAQPVAHEVVREELVDDVAPHLADRPQQLGLDRALLAHPCRHRVDRPHVVDVVDLVDARVIAADHRAQLARKLEDQLGADRVADRRVAVGARVDRIADVAVIREHAVLGELELGVKLERLQAERLGDPLLGGRRGAQQAIVVAGDVVKRQLAARDLRLQRVEEALLAPDRRIDDRLDLLDDAVL